MDCTFTDLPYRDTGYFSALVNAYVDNDDKVQPFIKYPASFNGIADAVAQRKKTPVNRTVLTSALLQQYNGLDISGKVERSIELLGKENTFTVCTAHQPAIFTGNLFFIYKIIHAIKLAEELNEKFPAENFVPVYYMGSEDADLDELGNIFVDGEKIAWDTKQTGAIGRMNTNGLGAIIARIGGELMVHPFGPQLVGLLKECYLNSEDIETATLKLVHHLFGQYGLLVLIPDSADLKRALIPVFEDELINQTSSSIVSKTLDRLSRDFRVQAQPRDINLFYLKDDIRERIERSGEKWRVVNTSMIFDKNSILRELNDHPERFSPNVILRGILQETLLPDVAFIGGGGELAYWMELKELFAHYSVAYPVLIVRNSFLVIEKKWMSSLDKLRLSVPDIFKGEEMLLNSLVKRDSDKQLSLQQELSQMNEFYTRLKTVAESVDITLGGHVSALAAKASKRVEALEKKMLRAEKRKFDEQSRQLSSIKKTLFPNKGLQERVDNFMPFYARWGNDFIKMIHDHSHSVEQKFGVLIVEPR